MNQAASAERADLNLDFATLQSSDRHAQYFNLLSLVFRRLVACYTVADAAQNHEREIVGVYLRCLLHTVEVLRIKYAWNGNRSHPLWVDLSASGFPNFSELSSLETEMLGKQERLRDLPAGMVLKRAILDRLFRDREEPAALLEQLSERTYLEMLAPERIFLPFTAGPIRLKAAADNFRNYDFSWACYDFSTNRVYMHFLNFDQDKNADPLAENGRPDFLRTVKATGGRAPDVGILAMALDESLAEIHPKMLRRRCLGPLYSRLLMEDEHRSGEPCETVLADFFRRHDCEAQDFVLFFTDEIVFSARQEKKRGQSKVREVYVINQEDPECAERHASLIQPNVLLPHRLLQIMSAEEQASIPGFLRCRKYVSDEGGKVHGI